MYINQIETARGHTLGSIITKGQASPDTGIPGTIGGFSSERLLKSPCDGTLKGLVKIGDKVKQGQVVAVVANEGKEENVLATIDGIIRGLINDESKVKLGMKSIHK